MHKACSISPATTLLVLYDEIVYRYVHILHSVLCTFGIEINLIEVGYIECERERESEKGGAHVFRGV